MAAGVRCCADRYGAEVRRWLGQTESLRFADPRASREGYELWKANPTAITAHDASYADAAESERLLQAVASAKLWTTPALDGSVVEDGAVWFIEARRETSYRIVTRINEPDETLKVLRQLLEMAGADVPAGVHSRPQQDRW